MICKHCKAKYEEHGSLDMGCPITDVGGTRYGFSRLHRFEAERQDWRIGPIFAEEKFKPRYIPADLAVS